MFIEKPSSKKSIAQRGLVYGVGINDSLYITEIKIDNKRFTCPFYKKWVHLLERCYSEKFHNKCPTYKDCSICENWLIFSNFKTWMIKQDWQGKHLDKDILIQGNKVYSPEACIFVESFINNLLIDRKADRGNYKIGVSWNKKNKRFTSQMSFYGKSKHLGSFDLESEANRAYILEKHRYIKEVAELQTEPLRSALINFKIN